MCVSCFLCSYVFLVFVSHISFLCFPFFPSSCSVCCFFVCFVCCLVFFCFFSLSLRHVNQLMLLCEVLIIKLFGFEFDLFYRLVVLTSWLFFAFGACMTAWCLGCLEFFAPFPVMGDGMLYRFRPLVIFLSFRFSSLMFFFVCIFLFCVVFVFSVLSFNLLVCRFVLLLPFLVHIRCFLSFSCLLVSVVSFFIYFLQYVY